VESTLTGHHGEVFAELVATKDVDCVQLFVIQQGFVGIVELPVKARFIVITEFLVCVGGRDQVGATGALKFFEVAPDVVVMEAKNGDTVYESGGPSGGERCESIESYMRLYF